jgi:hypothetical protein
MDNCAIHHDDEIRHIIEEECGNVVLHVNQFIVTYFLRRCQANLPSSILP